MSDVISPVVTLPRLNAADAIALVLALGTALDLAQSEQAAVSEGQAANSRGRRQAEAPVPTALPVAIPANISACVARLRGSCERLEAARKGDATPSATAPKRRSRKVIFAAYQRAWTAARSQVGVWREAGMFAALPAAQREALDAVFPDGGGAEGLTGSARRVWTAGRDLLATARGRGVFATFASLRSAEVLSHVVALHDELGAELGVTAKTRRRGGTSGNVAPALGEVQSGLREYVIKVSAMVEGDVPGSAVVAEALLAPFGEFSRAAPARSTKTVVTPQPVAPAKPAAPRDVIETPVLRPTGTG